MTISPDYSRQVARRVRQVYQDAEDVTLQRIIRAVAKGLDEPDWAARKAGDLRTVIAQIDRHLAQLDKAAPELIERAVADAYQAGTHVADVDMRAAGLDAIGGRKASRAVDVLAEDGVRAMSGMRPRVVREVADVYQRITADTTAQVLTGAQTRREAARDAVRRYTLDGVRPLVDSSGRAWEMGAYAEMATRTTAGQAAVAGHTDRLQALGQDLVIVSSSPESCDVCGPWEGLVLSISGSDRTGEAEGTLDGARGEGFQHPNCTHTVDLYLPGHTEKPTVDRDPEAHVTRQRQRAYERSIRRHKRGVEVDEAVLGKSDPRAVKSRQKLRDRQAEFKGWRDEHDRKNLPYRTNVKHR